MATRSRLLDAGARLFGLHGFEATSTRALASAAQANLGSILYHFGGKEGLYRAVLTYIVEIKQREVGPGLARVMAICDAPESGREELLAALRTLVESLVLIMLGDPESEAFAQIMMQEQIAPTSAYDILYEGFFAKVHGTWAALLSRLTGLRLDSTELRLRTLSIMGQLAFFRVGMTATLRHFGCERLSQEHLNCIIRFGIQQVEAIVEHCTPVCAEDRI